MAVIAAVVFAYLMGSISFGYLLPKLTRGIDVREHGSRNPGATNVFRVVGKKMGLGVLFLDALKGYLAVSIPQAFLSLHLHVGWFFLLGVIAILGHTFPVWLRFKGGKGVATSLGVFIALAPVPALITFAAWGVIFFLTRVISIASLSAALIFPVVIVLTVRKTEIFPILFPLSFLLIVFIAYTHRANIRRILRGEEKKII
ncbi:MAG: glycerol-3-phosphate 1-O-acyltransferase PlsY [Candidatus Omnitrophota bacterium]